MKKLQSDTEQISQAVPRLGFTVAQTAEILSCSQISVRRLLVRGLLKSSSALRTKIIPLSSIQQFLDSTSK